MTTPDEVLAAFRKVTGWTDAEVLHYAACESTCVPICGHEEDACPEGRAAREKSNETAVKQYLVLIVGCAECLEEDLVTVVGTASTLDEAKALLPTGSACETWNESPEPRDGVYQTDLYRQGECRIIDLHRANQAEASEESS